VPVFRDQVDRFVELVNGADLTSRVPSCPEWDLRALVGHVGQAHRHGAAVVRCRVTTVEQVGSKVEVPALEDASACRTWLVDGAEALITALAQADPELPVWNFAFGSGPPGFWLRRMTHETAVHRYDATLAAGSGFELGSAIAADGLSEFLSLMTSPGLAARRPEVAEQMRGTGQTLSLHADDRADGWLITRGRDRVDWEHRRSVAADVTVRGSAVDLLLLAVGRLGPRHAGLDVTGDAEVLRHWCSHVRF
jgi:uncharacterized protein (TIGR03083 family)